MQELLFLRDTTQTLLKWNQSPCLVAHRTAAHTQYFDSWQRISKQVLFFFRETGTDLIPRGPRLMLARLHHAKNHQIVWHINRKSSKVQIMAFSRSSESHLVLLRWFCTFISLQPAVQPYIVGLLHSRAQLQVMCTHH